MAWTYSGSPGSSDRDQLRFILQDVEINDQLFQDAELDYLLTSEGNPLSAAARGAEILLARFSRYADERVGQVSVSFSQRADNYRKLLADLKRRIALKTAIPYAGGISIADKDSQVQDEDRVQPAFSRNMDDYPGTGPKSEREELGDQ